VTEQAFNQVRVADLLPMPERHRRNLRVEQRVGDLVRQIVDDLEILPTRMEDLQHFLIVHEQIEERL